MPDLAGWRRERVPKLDDRPDFTLAPDWVCEVLSRQTASVDRAEKLPIYARGFPMFVMREILANVWRGT